MQLQLRVLGHPEAESLHSETHRQLVYWLENTKIRSLPEEGRSGLAAEDTSSWDCAFSQYLKQLNCPYVEPHSNLVPRIKWLLRHAVAQAYLEHKNVMSDLPAAVKAASLQQPDPSSAPPAKRQCLSLEDAMTDPERQSELAGIAGKLVSASGVQVTTPTSSLLQSLQAARSAITQRMQPVLAARRQGATQATFSHPLVFSDQDDEFGRVAKSLRVVYTREISRLQTIVDETMTNVQELTKNIRINNALHKAGKIGTLNKAAKPDPVSANDTDK